MNAKLHRLITVGMALLIGSPSMAGVSVLGGEETVATLVTLSITDDSDPLGSVWGPLGPSVPGTLQGNGGRPDVVFAPVTAWPKVVWAEQQPYGHSISFAEWTASGWTSTDNVPDGMAQDLDPRLHLEPGGAVHVVWWRQGALGEVYLITRGGGSPFWNSPTLVSTSMENARRPSVAVFNGQLWVAYERDSIQPGMAQDIVLARRELGGGFTRQVAFSTARTDRLDVMLHATDADFWIDWKQADTEFGCAELVQGVWSPIGSQPWTDPSWVGVEHARKLVERSVIGP